MGARFFESRSRYELARALSRRGEPGDATAAREQVQRALHLADGHGYRAVQRRAGALLVQLPES
jgi:hypothetical protein